MKVKVYGADHSPWVQAVLLGLHEKGIKHELILLPPHSVFRKWGILMPAVSIDSKPWQIDSTKILEKFDFDPISDKELRLVLYGAQQMYRVQLELHDVPHWKKRDVALSHSQSMRPRAAYWCATIVGGHLRRRKDLPHASHGRHPV